MDEPRKAHHIYLALCKCGCGQMSILLCNEDDSVFAEAIFGAQESVDLADDIVRLQDDNLGEACGHA